MSKRKCSNCGKPGHRATTCPEDKVDKEELKRQKALPNPTTIHMAAEAGYLCEGDRVEWPNRCDDAFAQTLPRCEKCEQAYRERWDQEPPAWPPE